MQHFPFKLTTACLALVSTLACTSSCANQTATQDTIQGINKNQPPLSLTLKQAFSWTTDSQFADSEHITKQPLVKRFSAPLNEQQAQLDKQVKVLIAPDGMNNFGNYLGQQNQFNLYNFTHWSNIDVLNWFAGTADQTINLPAKPWVETAHKNGVKVIGSVFLGVARWGGSPDTVEALMKKDSQGRYIIAHKLVEMASYYGFDGWLINQETDLSAVKDANNNLVEDKKDKARAQQLGAEMQKFVQYLTKIAPKGMEIHWYDAQIMNGEVRWQNELNAKNLPFIQDQEGERVSDAMFLNYWWNKDMAQQSHQFAIDNNVNPYEVYYGADLWPSRTAQKIFKEYQWLPALFSQSGEKGLGSIALFAPNANFNYQGNDKFPTISNFNENADDVYRFYHAENQLFSGMDANVAKDDGKNTWQGIGQYVPAKSVISQLPFNTSFNTGHGKVKKQQGKQTANAWTNIAEQDILPTWQFAVVGASAEKLTPYFDFDKVYHGGSSLALKLAKGEHDAALPLYKSALTLTEQSSLNLVVALPTQISTQLCIELEIGGESTVQFNLSKQAKHSTNWQTVNIDLAKYQGQKVTKIGFAVKGLANTVAQFNIGQLEIN